MNEFVSDRDRAARLERVVERVVAENERLRAAPGIVDAGRVARLEAENEALRGQLGSVRAGVGAQLSERYDAKGRAARRIMAEYEALRAELTEAKEAHAASRTVRQRLVRDLEEMKVRCAEAERRLASQSNGRMSPTQRRAATLSQTARAQLEAAEAEAERRWRAAEEARRLLRDSVRREQRLARENAELRRRLTALEGGGEDADAEVDADTASVGDLMMRLRRQRLQIERLTAERAVLVNRLGGANGETDKNLADELTNCDAVAEENVELGLRVKMLLMEKESLRQKLSEASNGGVGDGPADREASEWGEERAAMEEKLTSYRRQLQLLSDQFGVAVKF